MVAGWLVEVTRRGSATNWADQTSDGRWPVAVDGRWQRAWLAAVAEASGGDDGAGDGSGSWEVLLCD